MEARDAESLLDLAERTSPGLKGLDAKVLLRELEQRYGDLLAAIQWFIDQGRRDESVRLATSLAPFWMATKRLEDGSACFDRVLGSPGGEDAHRGQAYFQAGLLVFWAGDDGRASAFHPPGPRDRPPDQ